MSILSEVSHQVSVTTTRNTKSSIFKVVTILLDALGATVDHRMANFRAQIGVKQHESIPDRFFQLFNWIDWLCVDSVLHNAPNRAVDRSTTIESRQSFFVYSTSWTAIQASLRCVSFALRVYALLLKARHNNQVKYLQNLNEQSHEKHN